MNSDATSYFVNVEKYLNISKGWFPRSKYTAGLSKYISVSIYIGDKHFPT